MYTFSDIRLCFTGVLSANVTVLCDRTTSSAGTTTCKESLDVPMFNKSKFYPHSTYKPAYSLVDCWYLTTHLPYMDFRFYNRLQLSYEYDLDNPSSRHTLQIDIYNPHAPNPNVFSYLDYIPDYYLNSGTPSQQLETRAYSEWSQREVSDHRTIIKDSNQYTLDLNGNKPSHLMANFKYQTRLELSDSTWNVVGLSSIYEEIQEATLEVQPETWNAGVNDVSDPLACIITLQSTNFSNITLREQRIYTLISVLGSVGGLFALVAAIHSLLYGVRPASPYGLIHRYSPRKLKSSIRQALYNKFGVLEHPIPLVHPVDQEFFYDNKTLMQNDYGLTVHSTPFNKEKSQRETSYRTAEDVIEMLPTATANVQQTLYNGREATTKSQDNRVTANSSRTTSPDVIRLEGGPDQLVMVLTKQQEMYELLKNENQMMRRRQQLLEVMLKAYYLDSEVLPELSKAHDINSGRRNNDDVSVDIDSSEPPNTTL